MEYAIQNRTIHSFAQGSPEWHAHRVSHLNGSEAAAAQGISSHIKRTELVRMRATGDEREISGFLQRLFDDGHEYEEIARPWAEEIIGEELFRTTVSAVVEGLHLSSSFDGITMAEDTTWEHKSLNAALAAALEVGLIPEEYSPQCEQGLMLSGATRCLFMASNGTRESMKYAWYESIPAVRKKIIGGWKQFLVDVEHYKPVEIPPAASAAPVRDLPAVSVQVEGALQIVSNLPRFGERLHEFVAGINMEPADDQGFADAEAAVKALERAEKALTEAENAALSQTASIEDLRTTIAELKKTARDYRLKLQKRVESRKDEIRLSIVSEHAAHLAAHITKLNERLGKVYMPIVRADFPGAMKGKKTIVGLREAASSALAQAKIEANDIADLIALNLQAFRDHAKGYELLFADEKELCLKDRELVKLTIEKRISEHQRTEAERRQADAAKPAPVASVAPSTLTTPPEYATRAAANTGTPSARHAPSRQELVQIVAISLNVSMAQAEVWLEQAFAMEKVA